MAQTACGPIESGDGFLRAVGLSLPLTPSLGGAYGDEAFCRAVCHAVPGCNLIVRHSNGACSLDARCLGVSGGSKQPVSADSFTAALPAERTCAAGAATIAAAHCRPQRQWHTIDSRLKDEATHLKRFRATAEVCRAECERTPNCNGFRGHPIGGGRRRSATLDCQLFAGCADPSLSPTAIGRMETRGAYVSHFMWPCVEEKSIFPLPGLRRTRPPGEPSGLLSFDCLGTPPRAECHTPSPTPSTISLRWPGFYAPPDRPRILPLGAAEAASQRLWFGADLHQKLPPFLRERFLRGVGKRWPPRADANAYADTPQSLESPPTGPPQPDYFDLVTWSLAQRSFNQREVILIATNTQALPVTVNLVANLNELGYTHTLLLAPDDKVCPHLIAEAERPACGWSSLLTPFKPQIAKYAVGGVEAMWLLRWYYLLRLVLTGYNAMMLDADIVLYYDIYPFFKGAFGNYSLFCLRDSTSGYGLVNGGVWYIQDAAPGGPVEHMLLEFRRRTLTLLDPKKPVIRFGSQSSKRGKPNDQLLFDQWVISNVILSEVAGFEATTFSGSGLDTPADKLPRRVWTVPNRYPQTPPQLGRYGDAYPDRYGLREAILQRNGVREVILQAPPWLFAGESDKGVPQVPSSEQENGDGLHPRMIGRVRTSAAYWGARPPPTVLIHFVCAAWPGMGGRLAAMQLWGKWYALDIFRQLPLRLSAAYAPPLNVPGLTKGSSSARAGARVLTVNDWLRGCALACGVGSCTGSARLASKAGLRHVEVCAGWLQNGVGETEKLEAWFSRRSGKRPQQRDALVQAVYEHAIQAARVPPALVNATRPIAAAHPAALIAFRYPIRASSRYDYQLFVHLLHSAAMLTARRPVVPLAHCSAEGEWSKDSRCIWVVHSVAPVNSSWCLMRPPSGCLGRVALPTSLAEVPVEETEVVPIPRLGLVDGRPDAVGFARALGGPALAQKRVLLLDHTGLQSPEELTNLLISSKGWLCTLEHKSCQNTC